MSGFRIQWGNPWGFESPLSQSVGKPRVAETLLVFIVRPVWRHLTSASIAGPCFRYLGDEDIRRRRSHLAGKVNVHLRGRVVPMPHYPLERVPAHSVGVHRAEGATKVMEPVAVGSAWSGSARLDPGLLLDAPELVP